MRIHKTVPLLESTTSACKELLGGGSKLRVSIDTFGCVLGVVTNSSAAKADPIDTPSEFLSSRGLLEGVVEPSYWAVTRILFGAVYLTAAAGDAGDKGLKTRRV